MLVGLCGHAMLAVAPAAVSATGAEIYKAKCSSCHDTGAGHAPRIGVPSDWKDRFARPRAVLHAAAVLGVPNTAMAPKGGYAELSEAEVIAVVDHMLAQAGYVEPKGAAGGSSAAIASLAMRPNREGGDRGIEKEVAEALRETLAPPGAKVEVVDAALIVRGINIRVGVRDGVVTLMGVVDRGDTVKRAEALARSVEGVRGVTNRLVTGGMLDFD